jgi:hypothetical protein
MNTPNDAGRSLSVTRAQAELVELLARLVLAAIEAEAAATASIPPRATHDRRSGHNRA